jgi:hypothetical protein
MGEGQSAERYELKVESLRLKGQRRVSGLSRCAADLRCGICDLGYGETLYARRYSLLLITSN